MTIGSSHTNEVATLAGGCFWCLEAVFDGLQGVHSVESGYSGGTVRNPSYRAVCEGDTGHAEVVRITFDPQRASFRDLLEVFFTIHDPTTLNRQGSDEGTQYRSAVFFHTPQQEAIAREVVAELRDREIFDAPIVTEIVPAAPFYPAEAEHRDYYERNTQQPYCRLVVAPKVAKFRSKFLAKLKK